MDDYTSRWREIKRRRRKTLELALIVSLLVHLVILHAFPAMHVNPADRVASAVRIYAEDIPRTEQRRPKPPATPEVPIPSEPELLPENARIEWAVYNLPETPLPPPPPREATQEDAFTFVPYEKPPQPVGGLRAFYRAIRYPSKALQAHLEGRVVVGVLIDGNGNIDKLQILKDSGLNVGFEEAALEAIRAIQWYPAQQRDRPVKVWVAVPVRFELEYF